MGPVASGSQLTPSPSGSPSAERWLLVCRPCGHRPATSAPGARRPAQQSRPRCGGPDAGQARVPQKLARGGAGSDGTVRRSPSRLAHWPEAAQHPPWALVPARPGTGTSRCLRHRTACNTVPCGCSVGRPDVRARERSRSSARSPWGSAGASSRTRRGRPGSCAERYSLRTTSAVMAGSILAMFHLLCWLDCRGS